MSSNDELHVIYRILNSQINIYPFPHLYVENVFSNDFYLQLRKNWPNSNNFVSLADTGRVSSGDYKERHIVRFTKPEIEKLDGDKSRFWGDMADWFLGKHFMSALIEKFRPHIESRFETNADQLSCQPDALIVRDHSRYEIGPHTDLPHRLLSLLFYCPDDSSRSHLGTSIYMPKDRKFTCQGGPHYEFDLFNRVATMGYKPNSLFAFLRTDNSFHGVEPIAEDQVERDLILYNLRLTSNPEPPKATRKSSPIERFLKHLIR